MLELKLDIKDADYEALSNYLIPSLIKNKIAQTGAKIALHSVLKNKNADEKDKLVAELLNRNRSKILGYLNEKVTGQGLKCHFADFEAKEKH